MAFQRKKRIVRTLHTAEERRFVWYMIRGVITLIGVSVVCALIYFCTRIESLQVQEINIEGGETVDHALIRSKVDTLLTDTYLLLVPKRFAFLYPHDQIVEVLHTVPRIYDISVVRQKPTTLLVRFKEYTPHALLCDGESASSTRSCFFMDTRGYVFEEAPALQGGTILRHVHDELVPLKVGIQFDTQLLARVEAFTERIENELFFRVHEVHYTNAGDIEFVFSGGGALFATQDVDYDALFEKVSTLVQSKEFAHLEPGNFQYIDARFDTKIFVNEEKTDIATTTATSSESF